MDDKTNKISCYFCRDVGKDGGCPKCGKVKGKLVKTILDKTDGLIDESIGIEAIIPEYYRGKIWDRNTFVQYYDGKKDISRVYKLSSQMEKIHNIFKDGKIPNKSVLLIAPRQCSKQIWAYSCIQFAYQSGYKIFPVMSSDLIKRTLANMTEDRNNRYLKDLGYNLEDIMTADCLFVNIDPSNQRKQAYQIIDDLMCKRSAFNRSTIFLSRFDLDELCKTDFKGTFKDAIVEDNSYNRLRYPAVIQW